MDAKVVLSEKLALRIIECHKYLTNIKHEYIISKQLLRSGTSIGANIAESLYAESSEDFVHKLKIAQKESSETSYWIRLLKRSEIMEESLCDSLLKDCTELLRVISSIIKTSKTKL